jgi:hypothetical protein
MPPKAWSDQRERQYEHIKEGYEQRGKSEKTAEAIAARIVNKERAQHGEARHAGASSMNDLPASKRGGQRSHGGEGGRTREQLYEEAKRKGVTGRSSMNKDELQKAVDR